MKKIVIAMLLLWTVVGYAQLTIDQKLVNVLNDGTNGGQYKIAVQAKGTNLTWNNTLKGLTIDINYENTKVSFPTSGAQINAATSWNAMFVANGAPYTRSTTNPSSTFVRVLITSSSVGSNFDGTPAGLDFTNSYQTLVTLTFTILDNTAFANFSIANGSNSISLFDVHNDSLQSGNGPAKTLSAPVTIVNAPLPVEMTSFTGVPKGNKVQLTWKTATEVNSSAFQIERRTASDWKKIGELKAAGTSNAPREYSYVDDMENIGSGNILYRLKTVDNNGSYKYSSEVEVTAIPQVYELKANFPNPFNPETKIQYALPGNAKVRLVVYDIIGRQVAELVNEEQNAGYYEKTFSGSNLSSGMYFYRITAQAQGKNVFSQVKKMLLVK
jgi:hypothetical protein